MAGQPKSQSAPPAGRAGILERVLASEGEALRRVARANSARAADAEDALQDGYLAFLRLYEGGEEIEEALSWLRLVVKRFAWAPGKRERRRGPLWQVITVDPAEPNWQEVVLADPRPGTVELAERAEATERRIELLGRLKPDERATLILIGLGASYAEICELRGWTRTKVNRCATEGRERLRELEAGEGERT